MDLDGLLAEAVPLGASDIHLKLDRPPLIRHDGTIVALEGRPALTDDEIDGFLQQLTASVPERYQRVQADGDLALAYTGEGLPRFRVNALRQRGAISFVLRVIPREVPQIPD